MENLNKSVFTETITVAAHTVRPGDVFLFAGWRPEITGVETIGDLVKIRYSIWEGPRQTGKFYTFVDSPFTIISRKEVPEMKPPAIGENDVTMTCTKCWRLIDECECDIEHPKVPTASVFATDEALETLRKAVIQEKLTGAPRHSCQWRDNIKIIQAESERRRNLNISQAAEIETLEGHIRELSWQLELERSERDLDKTKRRIKKLKKKLSRGV